MREHVETFTTQQLEELLKKKLELEKVDPGGNPVRAESIKIIQETLDSRKKK